jgi:hypothetical protein
MPQNNRTPDTSDSSSNPAQRTSYRPRAREPIDNWCRAQESAPFDNWMLEGFRVAPAVSDRAAAIAAGLRSTSVTSATRRRRRHHEKPAIGHHVGRKGGGILPAAGSRTAAWPTSPPALLRWPSRSPPSSSRCCRRRVACRPDSTAGRHRQTPTLAPVSARPGTHGRKSRSRQSRPRRRSGEHDVRTREEDGEQLRENLCAAQSPRHAGQQQSRTLSNSVGSAAAFE